MSSMCPRSKDELREAQSRREWSLLKGERSPLCATCGEHLNKHKDRTEVEAQRQEEEQRKAQEKRLLAAAPGGRRLSDCDDANEGEGTKLMQDAREDGEGKLNKSPQNTSIIAPIPPYQRPPTIGTDIHASSLEFSRGEAPLHLSPTIEKLQSARDVRTLAADVVDQLQVLLYQLEDMDPTASNFDVLKGRVLLTADNCRLQLQPLVWFKPKSGGGGGGGSSSLTSHPNNHHHHQYHSQHHPVGSSHYLGHRPPVGHVSRSHLSNLHHENSTGGDIHLSQSMTSGAGSAGGHLVPSPSGATQAPTSSSSPKMHLPGVTMLEGTLLSNQTTNMGHQGGALEDSTWTVKGAPATAAVVASSSAKLKGTTINQAHLQSDGNNCNSTSHHHHLPVEESEDTSTRSNANHHQQSNNTPRTHNGSNVARNILNANRATKPSQNASPSVSHSKHLEKDEANSYATVLHGSIYFQLESILYRCKADRCILYLQNKKSGDLEAFASCGSGMKKNTVKNIATQTGLAYSVLLTGVAANLDTVTLDDVGDCPGPTRAKNALFFPVKSIKRGGKGATIGVLCLVNKKRGREAFSIDEERILHENIPSISYIVETYPSHDLSFQFDPVPLHHLAPLQPYTNPTVALPKEYRNPDIQLVYHRNGAEKYVRRQALTEEGTAIEEEGTDRHLRSVADYISMVEKCWKVSIVENMEIEKQMKQRQVHIADAREILQRKQRKLDVVKDALVDELKKNIRGESNGAGANGPLSRSFLGDLSFTPQRPKK